MVVGGGLADSGCDAEEHGTDALWTLYNEALVDAAHVSVIEHGRCEEDVELCST
jgi:hypothetical protein